MFQACLFPEVSYTYIKIQCGAVVSHELGILVLWQAYMKAVTGAVPFVHFRY